MKLGIGLLKYVPFLAIVAAAYKYYEDRGIDGIINDLQAITLEGIKAKIQQFAIGIGLVILADMVVKYIPNVPLRHIVKAIMYYIGASQVFGALRSGAASGGGISRSYTQPAMSMIRRR